MSKLHSSRLASQQVVHAVCICGANHDHAWRFPNVSPTKNVLHDRQWVRDIKGVQVLVDYILRVYNSQSLARKKGGRSRGARLGSQTSHLACLWEKRRGGERFCAPGKNTATTWMEAGRSCRRSAKNFLAFPLYIYSYIQSSRSAWGNIGFGYSPRGPRGEILYTGIRHTPLSVPTSPSPPRPGPGHSLFFLFCLRGCETVFFWPVD